MNQELGPYENNIGVGGKEVDEGNDVQIVEPSAKLANKMRDAVGKKKTRPRRELQR